MSLMLMIVIVAACVFVLVFMVSTAGFVAKSQGKSVAKWCGIALGAFSGVSVAVFSWYWFVSPLPSDEYMIRHFEKHREIYEKLAQGAVAAAAENNMENRALQNWAVLPDVMDMKKNVLAKDDFPGSGSDGWRYGIRVYTGIGDKKNVAYSMEFHLVGSAKKSFREHSLIWKSYWYYPEPQSLTEGKTRCPTGSGKKCVGIMNVEVLSSLDKYPLFDGRDGDKDRWCGHYLRQISDHWFIGSSKACL